MYSAVVWNGQKYDKWFPELAAKALVEIFADWQDKLIASGLSNWTAMFFGAVPLADGSIRTLWLPNYAEDYGKWKITLDVPNWPKVEAELDRLVARAQG